MASVVQALGIKLYKSEKMSPSEDTYHHHPEGITTIQNSSIFPTIMKASLILASALGAAAFPGLRTGGVPLEIRSLLDNAQDHDLEKRQQDALGISKAESNCGTRLCPTFDEEDQEVSVSREHQYIAPSQSDIRGPCPGVSAFC
jgi:hypothetical protein